MISLALNIANYHAPEFIPQWGLYTFSSNFNLAQSGRCASRRRRQESGRVLPPLTLAGPGLPPALRLAVK
jgi:hypothetical protein